MNKKNIMIFYKRNTIQIIALISLTMLLLMSCNSITTTEPLPTLMPTAAVSAIQPALNPTPTIILTPITWQTNSAIAPSLQEFQNYYRANHNFEWNKRPNHSGVTPWAGTLDDNDGERKLMLWVPIGESAVKEMFYAYTFPTDARLSVQQKKILYDEMIEIMSLSLPYWDDGKKWLVSSLDQHFSTGQEVFETQVNGTTVILDIGPSYKYNDFLALFSIY